MARREDHVSLMLLGVALGWVLDRATRPGAATPVRTVPQPGPLTPAVPLPTPSTGVPEYGGGGADF